MLGKCAPKAMELVGTRLLYMKKEPTVNVGFVMMHGPESEHLKKGCAGLYISIICQCSVKDEGLHNGDY